MILFQQTSTSNEDLKYSIQNAFDGNPATSYVENTEDDLIRIAISAEGVFDKVRLINGYAKNKELYYSNNRIKTVSSEFDSESEDMVEWGQKLTDKNERFPVQDGILTNQIVIILRMDIFLYQMFIRANPLMILVLQNWIFVKKMEIGYLEI